MTQSDRTIVEILEAFDLTRCAHSAAAMCGVDEKTVARYVAIRDGVLNHMAHHRGQLTVYLRMNGGTIPSLYGPSGDEGKR